MVEGPQCPRLPRRRASMRRSRGGNRVGLSVAFLQYADQSASRPGDCPSEWRVIMIGRTLARPTERVDLGQQRKVWRWEP